MDTDLTTRKLLSWWVAIVLATGVLIGAERLHWTLRVWTTSEFVTVPVKRWIWQQQASWQQQFAWWDYWRSGQTELVRLKRALRDQAGLVSRLGEAEAENATLRKLLGAPLPGNWQFLPAKIVGREAGSLVIDQGANQGIEMGMTVVANADQDPNTAALVGRINQVHPGQSWLQTVVSSDSRTPVLILDAASGQQRGVGLLRWETGELKVDKLLPEEKVTIGDVVVTKGEAFNPQTASGWLADIPIGVVTEVSAVRETDVYQQAKVSWLVDENSLERLFVVTKW